jgi:hypothetical protein
MPGHTEPNKIKADDGVLFWRHPILVSESPNFWLSFRINKLRHDRQHVSGRGLDNHGGGPVSTILGCLILFTFLWRRQQTSVKYYDTFCILKYIKVLGGKEWLNRARRPNWRSKPSKLSLARSRKCPGKRLSARIGTSKSFAMRIAWRGCINPGGFSERVHGTCGSTHKKVHRNAGDLPARTGATNKRGGGDCQGSQARHCDEGRAPFRSCP